MPRIRAVGAITAILFSVAGAWAAAPKPEKPTKTPTREEVAKSLEEEQKVYLERVRFCDRLRAISLETNDEKLRDKAEQIEAQAFELYMRRTAPLKTIVQDIKAAEAHLDERRNNPTPPATASRIQRAPNGRPIPVKEQ